MPRHFTIIFIVFVLRFSKNNEQITRNLIICSIKYNVIVIQCQCIYDYFGRLIMWQKAYLFLDFDGVVVSFENNDEKYKNSFFNEKFLSNILLLPKLVNACRGVMGLPFLDFHLIFTTSWRANIKNPVGYKDYDVNNLFNGDKNWQNELFVHNEVALSDLKLPYMNMAYVPDFEEGNNRLKEVMACDLDWLNVPFLILDDCASLFYFHDDEGNKFYLNEKENDLRHLSFEDAVLDENGLKLYERMRNNLLICDDGFNDDMLFKAIQKFVK